MNIDRRKPYIFTVKNFLSPAECQDLIDRIEREGPAVAPITTILGPVIRPDIRNNERVMFDDQELAALFYERAKEHVPAEVHHMQVVGVNERFRCYRYKPGMRFAPHADGAFYRNDREWSRYTFMVYLNEDFEGGHTTFFVEPEVSIKPETGMALFFQHELVHEGSEVTSGINYVARTDLMYLRPKKGSSA